MPDKNILMPSQELPKLGKSLRLLLTKNYEPSINLIGRRHIKRIKMEELIEPNLYEMIEDLQYEVQELRKENKELKENDK